jgi:hypothetical protein
MHHIHQPYKQILAHPLFDGHLLWHPHLKSKNKNKKPNVKLNTVDESYPLNNDGVA